MIYSKLYVYRYIDIYIYIYIYTCIIIIIIIGTIALTSFYIDIEGDTENSYIV